MSAVHFRRIGHLSQPGKVTDIPSFDGSRAALLRSRSARESAPASTNMMSELWESRRPTCPKRSTVGRFVLGTFEKPWHAYIDFHLDELGCQFWRANLDDLKKHTADDGRAFQARLMQSTIGFFRPG